MLLTEQQTGAGIPPDELLRVFDRFYRGREAQKGDDGESGLGLALARSIVAWHGGTISVESSLGWGTVSAIDLSACE